MLPILKRMKERKEKPQAAGIIVENRNPGSQAPKVDPAAAIESCMVHFLGAIAANDPRAMAEALTAAHDEMHAQMDQSKVEPHSYQAQNIKPIGEY